MAADRGPFLPWNIWQDVRIYCQDAVHAGGTATRAPVLGIPCLWRRMRCIHRPSSRDLHVHYPLLPHILRVRYILVFLRVARTLVAKSFSQATEQVEKVELALSSSFLIVPLNGATSNPWRIQ